jgi:hypothetical protein
MTYSFASMAKGKTACGVLCLAATAGHFCPGCLHDFVIFSGHDAAKAVVKREP